MNLLHSAFHKSFLFQGLSGKEIEQFIAVSERLSFQPNSIIIKEGENSNDFFLIISGSVEVLKEKEKGILHQIAILSAGETIGEVGIIEHSYRSATIRVLEETTVLCIKKNTFDKIIKDPKISALTYHNLAIDLSHRLQQTNEVTVTALQSSLEQAKDKIYMGNAMVSFLIVSGMYSIFLQLFSNMAQYSISGFLLVAMALITTLMVKSGYSMEFYGITTKNWKKAALEGILWSIPIMIALTAIKYFAIQTLPSLSNEPLITLQQVFIRLNTEGKLFLVPLYIIISSPLQELLFRGCLQGTLQRFLISPHKGIIANFTTSLLFCMAHFFLSPLFALFSLMLSLTWGEMYKRHQTLIGVVISHVLIGAYAIFGLDAPYLLKSHLQRGWQQQSTELP